MHCRVLIAIVGVVMAYAAPASSQARSLSTSSSRPVILPSMASESAILGSVLLGRPRVFTVFNIQAAGNITPDPDANGATFQLQFLICDAPDCRGQLHSPVRILPDGNAARGTQLIATRSFGVSTHNSYPVDLKAFRPATASGDLYLALGLRALRSTSSTAFTGKLNLLRVDVLP